MKILLLFISFALLAGCSSDKSQQAIGKVDIKWSARMANAAMMRCDSLMWANDGRKPRWQYDVAMLGQAIDKLGYIDTIYSKYHEDYLNYFIQDDDIKNYGLEEYNLDNVNPAKGLITLYKRTGKEKYLNAINLIVKQLEQQPKTKSGGFWH